MADARSLWFTAPRHVELRHDHLAPLQPGQVLVRSSFSGISSGTERLAYRGEIDPDVAVDETIAALTDTFRFPFRYGYSCVGIVEESRAALHEGTLVFAFHPHQDRFLSAASDVVELGAVDARSATLFPLVETALQVTLDAGAVLNDTVAVFGLGAVGLLTALMLQRAGAHPLTVEPLAWRRAAADALGLTTLAPADIPSRIADIPLVVDASGDPAVLPAALPLLAHEGTILVASWYGTKEVTLALGREFHRRRLTIRSTQVSTIPARLADRWDADRRRRTVAALLTDLPLDVLATHTFPFDDAGEAFRAVDEGREGLIHAALGYG